MTKEKHFLVQMLITSRESKFNKVIHFSKISSPWLTSFTNLKEFMVCHYMPTTVPKVLVMALMENFCNPLNSSYKSHLMKQIKIKIYSHKQSEKEIKLHFCNNKALYNVRKLSCQLEHLFNIHCLRSPLSTQVPISQEMTNLFPSNSILVL